MRSLKNDDENGFSRYWSPSLKFFSLCKLMNSSQVIFSRGLANFRTERSSQLLFRSVLAVYVCTLVLLEVFCIMPVLLSGCETAFAVYFLVGLYLLIGFVYNAIQIVRKDPSIRGMLLANKVTRQWTYCVSCQSPRPPRTHHCHVCNVCVLRRDHHCVFLGRSANKVHYHVMKLR